ncbi:hypothetical protein HUG17_5952 [Dermatophagoides farinae]|uniref:Uncharacterized protein n=1 Tax=Dermatophagoides farinae TaxID=6954 RepID=A0A9D4P2L5_DERFA|nr:hypothetical protein HUG17_5952 [Dermatophagoides farinae]
MEFVHNQLVDQIETLKQSLKMAEETMDVLNADENLSSSSSSSSSTTEVEKDKKSSELEFFDATKDIDLKTAKENIEKLVDENKVLREKNEKFGKLFQKLYDHLETKLIDVATKLQSAIESEEKKEKLIEQILVKLQIDDEHVSDDHVLHLIDELLVMKQEFIIMNQAMNKLQDDLKQSKDLATKLQSAMDGCKKFLFLVEED